MMGPSHSAVSKRVELHPRLGSDPMLISRKHLDRIAAGEIDRAFRRWKRPTVRAGGTLRTSIGLLAIDSVEPITDADVTEEDARHAGFESREALSRSCRSGRSSCTGSACAPAGSIRGPRCASRRR